MAWHNLQPNHSTALPQRVIFVDTETIKEREYGEIVKYNNYLRCGVAITGHYKRGKMTNRNVIHFDEQEHFWRWVETFISPQYTTWIVAHKMSYDFGVLGGWNMIDTGELKLDMPRGKRPITSEDKADVRLQRGLLVIDDPPFIIGLRGKCGGRMILVDTLNWFKSTLRELGDSIGLEKGEFPPSTATHRHWQLYCERDCEIVEKAFCGLIDFVKDHDCGMFRYTAASQSMAAFRHAHLNNSVVLHDEIEVKKLERRTYYGGESRVFYSGEVNSQVYQVDVNGLYPYVMRENLYPRKLSQWRLEKQTTVTPQLSDVHCQCCDVELLTNSGVFPIRTKESVAYVGGRFHTSLCGPELTAAESRGEILKYINTSKYLLSPIFREYVNFFHSLRLQYRSQRNGVYATLCKTLLNSLYGKWGQRTFKWQHRPDVIPPTSWYKWIELNQDRETTTIFRSIGQYTFQQMTPEEHPQSFPAICSFVTAYGREYMRKLRSICGPQTVYYQACDALFVSQEGLDNLRQAGMMHADELGKLKVASISDSAEFRGINNYTLGTIDRISGVKPNAVKTGERTWIQESFEGADLQVNRKPQPVVKSWETIFTLSARAKYTESPGYGWLSPIILDSPTAG